MVRSCGNSCMKAAKLPIEIFRTNISLFEAIKIYKLLEEFDCRGKTYIHGKS